MHRRLRNFPGRIFLGRPRRTIEQFRRRPIAGKCLGTAMNTADGGEILDAAEPRRFSADREIMAIVPGREPVMANTGPRLIIIDDDGRRAHAERLAAFGISIARPRGAVRRLDQIGGARRRKTGGKKGEKRESKRHTHSLQSRKELSDCILYEGFTMALGISE